MEKQPKTYLVRFVLGLCFIGFAVMMIAADGFNNKLLIFAETALGLLEFVNGFKERKRYRQAQAASEMPQDERPAADTEMPEDE